MVMMFQLMRRTIPLIDFSCLYLCFPFFCLIDQLQCWIDLGDALRWQLYMCWVATSLFVIPAFIISACYVIIIKTIWSKGSMLGPVGGKRKWNSFFSSSPTLTDTFWRSNLIDCTLHLFQTASGTEVPNWPGGVPVPVVSSRKLRWKPSRWPLWLWSCSCSAGRRTSCSICYRSSSRFRKPKPTSPSRPSSKAWRRSIPQLIRWSTASFRRTLSER